MRLASYGDTIASARTSGSIDDGAWIGSRLGRDVGGMHRVVRHLGSGGMGHVFLAEHMLLGAYAAVKLPRPDNHVARMLLAREAALLSRLEHPNIVSAIDFGRMRDGLEYLLMSYSAGIPLDAWLDSCGRMPPARALAVLEQVAAAVDYAHAHGVVHCDIKPANIMIDPGAHDFIELIDFGIARCANTDFEPTTWVGTPAYMAPEQIGGDVCGPAVDVYGVSVLSMELLTGRPPYARAIARAEVQLKVPGLAAVIQRGLDPDPRARYRSAMSFVEALEDVFSRR